MPSLAGFLITLLKINYKHMKTQVCFIALLLLVSFSCKSGKDVSSKTDETKETEVKEPVEDNSDGKIEYGEVYDDSGADTPDLDIPDSLYVSMERTACLGTCPNYKLSIYESGFAIYEGLNFVNKEGKYYAKMNDPELEKIRGMVNEIEYFKLSNKYDSPITDIPSTITIVNIDGKQKKIVNRYKGPKELERFENMLDEIADRFEWKKLEQTGEE